MRLWPAKPAPGLYLRIAGSVWGMRRRSGDAEQLLLCRPRDRQVHGPDQTMRGQFGRLPARGNRVEDVRREHGERQQGADVTIADPFGCREFGDTADSSGDERLEAAMGSPDLLQQGRIAVCCCGRSRRDRSGFAAAGRAHRGQSACRQRLEAAMGSGRLTDSFNKMVGELRVKERIRDTFGKYIDPRIVAGLIDRPELTDPKGARREMTILFCDTQDFTTFSEGMTPVGLVNVMNRYLTVLSEPVRRNSGIIDKYIGDAVMAFWGPPFAAAEDEARLACFAAIDQLGGGAGVPGRAAGADRRAPRLPADRAARRYRDRRCRGWQYRLGRETPIRVYEVTVDA